MQLNIKDKVIPFSAVYHLVLYINLNNMPAPEGSGALLQINEDVLKKVGHLFLVGRVAGSLVQMLALSAKLQRL